MDCQAARLTDNVSNSSCQPSKAETLVEREALTRRFADFK
jgi:hypothetical protein